MRGPTRRRKGSASPYRPAAGVGQRGPPQNQREPQCLTTPAPPISNSPAATRAIPMTFEFAVPGDWPPGLALAFVKMMEKALDDGFPIVIPVRKDATPEQISQVFKGVRALVERLGLAAAQVVNP